jgi:cell division transport system ATP-binding protein
MINFQNVSKNYDGLVALKDVDFKIEAQEFVSIAGKSGAGKSTIVKLLTSEEKPTKGRIFFKNIEVNKIKNSALPYYRRHIGVIFQDFRLLQYKTAAENVAFALEASGWKQKDINELVPQALDMVGVYNRANAFPYQLSGGEKQRVAIARAMVNHPEIIIADEPTGNLDPYNTWEIIKLLLKINELGTTILLATHDKEIINSLNKRVITLEEGRIIRDEPNGKYILA